jgi:hypothetical protein
MVPTQVKEAVKPLSKFDIFCYRGQHENGRQEVIS